MNKMSLLRWGMLALLLTLGLSTAQAACRDAVVAVHGNTGYPSHFNNLYNRLISNGYSSAEIFRPSWGSKYCAGCNDHSGSEETPVKNAISAALAKSCTGKIDVLGHSMGVTLAMQQILKMGVANRVDAFVGIAGGVRGLNSCGTWPYSVYTTACGYWGLSKKNGLVEYLRNKRVASRIYSIKSYNDSIVCAGLGGCYVEGTHTSNVWYQNGTYDYNNLGHMDLVYNTSDRQYSLIQ